MTITSKRSSFHWNLANIGSNDSRNCLRECDGQTKVCYFEFKVENFYAMGGYAWLNSLLRFRIFKRTFSVFVLDIDSPCGNCAKGNIDDCFAKDCVTMNGVERNVMSINHQIPGTGINVISPELSTFRFALADTF